MGSFVALNAYNIIISKTDVKRPRREKPSKIKTPPRNKTPRPKCKDPAQRMQQVEDHTNSSAFAACGGGGLEGLAKELRSRCEEVMRRKGERLPK